MTLFAILLAVAAAAFGLARLLHLPAIPFLVLGGFALRFLTERIDWSLPPDLLRGLIEVGLAVLVFTAGTELSPRRMRGRTRSILIVALAQFLSLGMAGLLMARLLGYDWITAGYIGCALSASSTLVVVRLMQQRRQMFEPYGRLVIGVLLLQDVLIILLLVALMSAPEGGMAVMRAIGASIALGLLSWLVHRYAVPLVCQRVKLDDEELMLGSLALLFTFGALAWVLEVNFLVGALCAGFALSAFPMNGLVRGLLGSLSGFFLALFFICIGFVLTLPGLEALWHGVLLTAVLIGVTVILVTIVAEATGYSTRASIESALLLSQTSEFSLLIALAGLYQGQITTELFSLIALVTIGTMTLTPFIARERVVRFLMTWHPRYRRGEEEVGDMSDHVLLLGYGRSGARILESLEREKVPAVVVDEDAVVIRKLASRGIPCVQGDAADAATLRRANAQKARAVLVLLRHSRDSRFVMEHLSGHPARVFVRTMEPLEAAAIQALGGTAIRADEAAADQLMEWLRLNTP
ncbi:MAG: cation:proton antiporter [Oceanipulchritudo sp.]